MTKIGIIFGGPSPEHDISILTGLQACRLVPDPASTVAIYWSRTGDWYEVPLSLEGTDFLQGLPPGAKPLTFNVPGGFAERKRMRDAPLEVDVALNCCHGGPGEDGTLGAMLLLAGIKASGPEPEPAAWAMDKLASASMPALAGLADDGIESIPTAPVSADRPDPGFPGPWVVKPRFGGSSLGVELGIEDLDTIAALCRAPERRGGAVAQPHLRDWTDLNIAVRTHPAPEASPIERPITSGAYGYREKYLAGAEGMESARRELPAQLPDEVTARITRASLRLAQAVGLSGLPRIDFLWDGNERLMLCEVNSIPGSLGLYLWAAAGHERAAIVRDVLTEAQQGSVARPQWSASTDMTALRSADSVAAKLR